MCFIEDQNRDVRRRRLDRAVAAAAKVLAAFFAVQAAGLAIAAAIIGTVGTP